ncbi:hypothetical protein Q4F19_09455 [Sphingomonas sp. BIUV-7]|uniref:Uncharacterized protein n=1 Tax=Sphingomonas natans TaxID=3063330 RepID=A0ABT8Y8E5_9SPHN|nr:hypothetical protein [Sphingomonas sp. BIUV-7]MDO6414606.1 hypothetical protein [Sphingomonas sp. BIUV-7]
MADVETLPPVEIPWKFASTTQPLLSTGPAETALSLFTFEPDDAAITRQFPDEKLVYVKVVASVSPAAFPRGVSTIAATYLGDGIPCFHLLLDLSVERQGGDGGEAQPYFHTAAPLSRSYIQTGVLGTSVYEGESDGIAIGKSGSQMHETLRSHSNTSSASASAGLAIPIPIVGGIFGASGSVRSSSTDVASARNVSQSTDTLSRNASDERRELTSHTTRVENIVSLLSAKFVGTPYLRFSVAPQPLQQLSVDPNDPNVWFQQLLARRSSGLEGIQEFVGLVVMPKDADICVHARLRRVCLLDSSPSPLAFEERFTGSLIQLSRMVNYLNRTFPPGTPLDDLDIDIAGNLDLTGPSVGSLKRPVLSLWGLLLGEQLVVGHFVSPTKNAGVSGSARANYKHMLEVWLDTLRDEYEIEVSRSPLERGALVGDNRFLHTCFKRAVDGGNLSVDSSDANVTPLIRIPVNKGSFDIGGAKTSALMGSASARTLGVSTAVRWNALESAVGRLLANDRAVEEVALDPASPEIRSILIDVWRKLPVDDPRNVSFDDAASMLKLSGEQQKQLRAAGATNLSTIAAALASTTNVQAYNTQAEKVRQADQGRKDVSASPDALDGAISPESGSDILKSIGHAVASTTRPGG